MNFPDFKTTLLEVKHEIRSGNLVGVVTRFSDILLVTMVVCIVGMMLIPLPTRLLDILLTCNITLAVTILMVAMYIGDATQLASFPTILLVTTLFRLSLNISSTRLILLQAYAGEVIDSFGRFVAGGSIIVGAVIFLLITLVQFIVITKGAERVAEVAARFTLDAMPGKQMSIDADLRSGSIGVPEARRRRDALQRESQLYGAMDGAMKFVKGDAIAGIIITGINIIAGLTIGVLMRGMEVSSAVQTYSILTIGDGLVSQIPALLISVSAAMVTTRVASEEKDSNLGRDVAKQILAQPRALAVVAVMLFVLALVPGLPKFPFFVLALAMAALAYSLFQAVQLKKSEQGRAIEEAERLRGPALRPTEPVSLELAEDLFGNIQSVQTDGRHIDDWVSRMRESLYQETGVLFPAVQVTSRGDLPRGAYRICLDEVPVFCDSIPPESDLAVGPAESLTNLEISGETPVHQETRQPRRWIPRQQASELLASGLEILSPVDVILSDLVRVLRRHAREFLGVQEVQVLLTQFSRYYPALVEEVVPKAVPHQQLVEILQRLVDEGVPIRDLRCILQTLGEWVRVEKDPVALAEQVRIALRRRITYSLTGGASTLYVYQVDPQLEELIRNSIRHTATGPYMAMEPDQIQCLLKAVKVRIEGSSNNGQARPVVVTDADLRRFVRKLLEHDFPEVAVLSYQELDPDIIVQPLAVLSLN